jgi:hypothetical protein
MAAHLILRPDVADRAAEQPWGMYTWRDWELGDALSVNIGLPATPPRLPPTAPDACAACAIVAGCTQDDLLAGSSAVYSLLSEALDSGGPAPPRDTVYSALGLVPMGDAACDWVEQSYAVHPPAPADGDHPTPWCRVTLTETFASWRRMTVDAGVLATSVVPADAVCASCWARISDGSLPLLPLMCVRDAERGWDVMYIGGRTLLGQVTDADVGSWTDGSWMSLRNGAWVWHEASPSLIAACRAVAAPGGAGGGSGAAAI